MKLLTRFLKKEPDHSKWYFYFFEKLYQLEPNIFYWVQPFTGKAGRYILTHFKHDDYVKYNGLEIVIIDKAQMTYHRLPGAKPNGGGHVDIGNHYISINSMREDERHYLHVEKINTLDLAVKTLTTYPSAAVNYVQLECRGLPYHQFISELTEMIISGLEYHYRVRQLSPDLLSLLSDMVQHPLNFRIKMLAYRILALSESKAKVIL
jgi:hypothetical protein